MNRTKLPRSLTTATLCLLTLSVCIFPLVAEASGRPLTDQEIRDVSSLSQNPFYYISEDYNKRLITEKEQQEYMEEFRKMYFSPWFQQKPRHLLDVHQWIFDHFREKNGYGENLRSRPDKWLKGLRQEANLSRLGSLNKSAVAVRETDLRLLPTDKPFFYDPSLPGEGYPFDYIQNSGVHGGEPLFVSHLSRDGSWAWCDTSYAGGWIRIEDIAFVDEQTVKKWTSSPLGVCIEENISFRDEKGTFRFHGKTGTILPILSNYISGNRVILPVRDMDGNMVERTASVPILNLKPFPLPFTIWNTAEICEHLIDGPYGWGGLGKERDCSATIRDIFIPFGIWLPRNSGAQARSGLGISFEGMKNHEKIEAIVREGKPFSTLINKRGHVMLYIGTYRGIPLILHNTWGIKTLENDREGRKIIGKTVITTLEPGKELPQLYPEKGLLLDSVTGITLLGGLR